MWWYWDLELDNRKTQNRSGDLLEDIGFYYDDDTESYSDEEYDKEDKSIKMIPFIVGDPPSAIDITWVRDHSWYILTIWI